MDRVQVVPVAEYQLDLCKALFLEMGDSDIGPGENFRQIPSRTKLDEVRIGFRGTILDGRLVGEALVLALLRWLVAMSCLL